MLFLFLTLLSCGGVSSGGGGHQGTPPGNSITVSGTSSGSAYGTQVPLVVN